MLSCQIYPMVPFLQTVKASIAAGSFVCTTGFLYQIACKLYALPCSEALTNEQLIASALGAATVTALISGPFMYGEHIGCAYQNFLAAKSKYRDLLESRPYDEAMFAKHFNLSDELSRQHAWRLRRFDELCQSYKKSELSSLACAPIVGMPATLLATVASVSPEVAVIGVAANYAMIGAACMQGKKEEQDFIAIKKQLHKEFFIDRQYEQDSTYQKNQAAKLERLLQQKGYVEQ